MVISGRLCSRLWTSWGENRSGWRGTRLNTHGSSTLHSSQGMTWILVIFCSCLDDLDFLVFVERSRWFTAVDRIGSDRLEISGSKHWLTS